MTATRASSGRSGLQTSIFAKAAALVALTTIAVAAMVLFSAQRSAYGIVHQHLVDLMIANTDATAGSIGGHIKFGKVDSVMLELENHADKAAEHFVAIGAWMPPARSSPISEPRTPRRAPRWPGLPKTRATPARSRSTTTT